MQSKGEISMAWNGPEDAWVEVEQEPRVNGFLFFFMKRWADNIPNILSKPRVSEEGCAW